MIMKSQLSVKKNVDIINNPFMYLNPKRNILREMDTFNIVVNAMASLGYANMNGVTTNIFYD